MMRRMLTVAGAYAPLLALSLLGTASAQNTVQPTVAPSTPPTVSPTATPWGDIPTGRAAEGPALSPPTPTPTPTPRSFVSKHVVTVGGMPIRYTAIAGETYLHDGSGEPIGSVFSFTYLKDAPPRSNRPVLFVFNGGPGSSSVWLHMGVVGPRRLVLDREVDPSNVPHFGITDNPNTLLDVADLVFIDPVGTGWSRPIGKGTTRDFWGVDEDADATAQFIEQWLTDHERWGSAKFVMGESYGSVRAALLPRALMGGPLYIGRMRGITLNGVVLLGTTLDARDEMGRTKPVLDGALDLPAVADTAWYHNRIDRRGRSLEAFHQEVLDFARGPYAQALRLEAEGRLDAVSRAAVIDRLITFTGASPGDAEKPLAVSGGAFARTVLADRGLQVGLYDSRYTLPLAGSGGDPVADDPAMGRYVPGFVATFQQMAKAELGIRMGRPYGAIVWKDLLPSWNWKRRGMPQGQSFAVDLAVAMRRTPKMRVLVASGYYDLATNSAVAEYQVEQAHLPADRLQLRRYASGHMLYLGDTAGRFADDVRKMIRAATR